jgi:ELWxxDGT repeat protein
MVTSIESWSCIRLKRYRKLDVCNRGTGFPSPGTSSGTTLVTRLGTGAAFIIGPLAALSTRFVFVVANASAGADVWGSDGTATGTRLLRHIGGTVGYGTFTPLIVVLRGRAYFCSDNMTLWEGVTYIFLHRHILMSLCVLLNRFH